MNSMGTRTSDWLQPQWQDNERQEEPNRQDDDTDHNKSASVEFVLTKR